MRVLVLCKRQYTQKDLLDDRYGRLFELPTALAARGHAVAAAVSSYRMRGKHSASEAGVFWQSVDLLPMPWNCLRSQTELASKWRPDVIWASSDALHLAAGASLGRRMGIPVVLDWYDDYSGFGLSRVPGIEMLLRSATAAADALTVVSQTLANLLPARGKVPRRIRVIGNGIPAGFDIPLDQRTARKSLGLPLDARLVGTAGALHKERGIEDLYTAFRELRARMPELRLVLAGPRDTASARVMPEDTIDLGVLPYAQIPSLFRSLDVGVICNRDSVFGRACHPQKLGEMVASELPLVASAVGETAVLLGARPDSLYQAGNATHLARQIEHQLLHPEPLPRELAASWQECGRRLEAFLEEVVADFPRASSRENVG